MVMDEVVQRVQVQGGLVELLQLPCGGLIYRSSATGYALYSDNLERALIRVGHLQGKI